MYKYNIFKLLPYFFIKIVYKFRKNVMGIHYDYKSTRGAKAMEKQAKREKKLAEKRAKKKAKSGVKTQDDKTIPIDQVITLDHLTNPNKK